MTMITFIQTWLATRAEDSERGAGFAEYALLLALIAVVGIVTLGPLGDAIAAIFGDITAAL